MRLLWVILIFALGAPAAPGQERRRVLIIGIDGCRPDALLKAKAPHLHGLIKNGAFSAEALTGDMTSSGPGWSSMLTGVWREKHGIRDNKFENADLKTYPHLFVRLKEKRPTARTASIVHWAPINEKIIAACDVVITRKTDAEVCAEAEKVLTAPQLDAIFVHFDDVDGAGHKHGFHPSVPAYLEAITAADDRVGRLLAALAKRAKTEDWLILVSTDHGGKGKGHGGKSAEERTVFVIVQGGKAKGTIAGPCGVVDVAVTALDHLGVPVRASWNLDGRSLLGAGKKD
ncbi:MAG: alkaline phosphatase family protein [Gemmataceae bacterium]